MCIRDRYYPYPHQFASGYRCNSKSIPLFPIHSRIGNALSSCRTPYGKCAESGWVFETTSPSRTRQPSVLAWQQILWLISAILPKRRRLYLHFWNQRLSLIHIYNRNNNIKIKTIPELIIVITMKPSYRKLVYANFLYYSKPVGIVNIFS